MNTVRIPVAGATGYIGSRLVTALLMQGHEAVAAGRSPGRLADVGWHDLVATVQLDAASVDSVIGLVPQGGPE
ncbi:MAG: NAD(P)H-binding protein [Actinomycetia bacterium]|nr:NAD(P)H-binding protein [Actinomycetes bacterium]